MTDYTVGDTVYGMFTTRAFATGIPTVLAGTPVVSAYENDSATQITAGITLGVSHDSVVGMNLLTIVATGANGFESGKDYNLVVTTGTVSSVSVVGEVVFTFSLGRSAAAVDLANGTDGLGAIKTDTAAILVDTGTTLDTKINTIDTNVDSILVDTAEIGAAGAGLTAINLPNQTMDIVGNITGNLSGSVGSVTAINTTGGAIDLVTLVTTTTTNTDMRGTDSAATAAALATVDANVDAILVDTGTTIPATLGTPAADISADIAAVKVDTAAILVDTAVIGVAGAGLTDLGGMSTAMKAEVNVEAKDVLFTDTISELSQGVPATTPSVSAAMMLLYMDLRNKADVTSSTKEVHNDAGTVITKKALSDNGTTYSEAKMVTGP